MDTRHMHPRGKTRITLREKGKTKHDCFSEFTKARINESI